MNPGDDSLSAAFNVSQQQEALFHPSFQSMFSTPLKSDNIGNAIAQLTIDRDQFGIAGNSVVITPPADTIATFDPLASKAVPLATHESSANPCHSTVGHYWKTFDEDDVISPGSGLDESSSESSDDENFSDNFIGQKVIPAKERNGWVDLSENAPNGSAKHDAGLGSSGYQQNGILHRDLKTLQIDNSNHIDGNTVSDTRTAIQTDF